jgi:hypothetical protein
VTSIYHIIFKTCIEKLSNPHASNLNKTNNTLF